MKILLIPTDFSAASQKALQYGLSFLRERSLEGRILLLNTYLLPNASANRLVAIHDELRNKSTQKLNEQVCLAEKTIPAHPIHFEALSRMGTLENVMVHLAEEQQVDAVILGINGNPKEKERVTRLLSQIHCPLILVP